MHERTLRLIRRRRISQTEDSPTDTPYDLVRRKTYQKRDIAFWFGLCSAMAAVGVKAIVDFVRTVR